MIICFCTHMLISCQDMLFNGGFYTQMRKYCSDSFSINYTYTLYYVSAIFLVICLNHKNDCIIR